MSNLGTKNGHLIYKAKHLSMDCTASCSPFVLASATTYSGAPWDLRPYQGPGQAPPGSYWRLMEMGYCTPYGQGCVDASGTLVGLPDFFYSSYAYAGYMQLQIGCLDAANNRIIWPGGCS